MVKANELRIGNWLNDSATGDKNYFQANAVDISVVESGRGKFFGIKLTPSVIEACGFHKGEKWFIHQIFYIGQFNICCSRSNEFCYGEPVYNDSGVYAFNKKSKRLDYLHELQNLYCAFNGIELTIDKNKL